MRMLRRNPTGKSLPGLPGIVTSPGLEGCLYWRWLPRVRLSTHPSSSMSLSISRTFTRSLHLSAGRGPSLPSCRDSRVVLSTALVTIGTIRPHLMRPPVAGGPAVTEIPLEGERRIPPAGDPGGGARLVRSVRSIAPAWARRRAMGEHGRGEVLTQIQRSARRREFELRRNGALIGWLRFPPGRGGSRSGGAGTAVASSPPGPGRRGRR